MDGAVDVVRQREGRTRFSGWASDNSHRTPADRIAIFVNGEADHYGHTEVSRSDLVDGFGSPSMARAGFDVVLSEPIFEQDQPPMVRIFAISTTSVASELWYRSEYADGPHQRRLGASKREIRYSLLANQDGSESIVSPGGETIAHHAAAATRSRSLHRRRRCRASAGSTYAGQRLGLRWRTQQANADQVVIFVNDVKPITTVTTWSAEGASGPGSPRILRGRAGRLCPA